MAEGFIVCTYYDKIEKCEVLSAAAKQVKVKRTSLYGRDYEQRMNRVSSDCRFFDTYDEARTYLVNRLRNHIAGYRENLALAEAVLKELEASHA